MDAISTSAQGLTAAAGRFDRSAVRTVTGEGDPAQETVEQVNSKAAFDASAAVLRTADQMLGALLDIKT